MKRISLEQYQYNKLKTTLTTLAEVGIDRKTVNKVMLEGIEKYQLNEEDTINIAFFVEDLFTEEPDNMGDYL